MPEIRHLATLVARCAAVLLVVGVLMAPAAHAKPEPPMSIGWDRRIEQDKIRLTLTVLARIPLPRAEVRVSASDGIPLEGTPLWKGELARGERKVMVFWVPGGAKGAITGVIDASTALNVHFTAGTTVYVPTDHLIRKRRPHRPGFKQGLGE